jgi:hypothetical protein
VPTQQFGSQENYFPVFEGNTRDLQTLEARVVVNITAFYTYMKAVRDSMRILSEIRPEPADLVSPPTGTAVIAPWHEALRNVIYMFFLGLESARRAISDLVEFEPERAERTIVILISELEAYRFLCDQFQGEDGIRHKRLMLRQPEYRRTVPPLIQSVEASRASETTDEGAVSRWEEAWRLLEELRKRTTPQCTRSRRAKASIAVKNPIDGVSRVSARAAMWSATVSRPAAFCKSTSSKSLPESNSPVSVFHNPHRKVRYFSVADNCGSWAHFESALPAQVLPGSTM